MGGGCFVTCLNTCPLFLCLPQKSHHKQFTAPPHKFRPEVCSNGAVWRRHRQVTAPKCDYNNNLLQLNPHPQGAAMKNGHKRRWQQRLGGIKVVEFMPDWLSELAIESGILLYLSITNVIFI
ncbi:hypothetical protein HanPI659440_Chr01g0000221 [Helianthus annuus]|nr:hypothetical protein HanPI659440_Chr01g0000221 [Helianthus annuus]